MLRASDYRPYPFEVLQLELDITLDPKETEVLGTLHMKRKPGHNGAPLVLYFDEKTPIGYFAVGDDRLHPEKYPREGAVITVRNVPDEFEVRTIVKLSPETNTSLEGLYMVDGVFYTQCEAEGFRKITPYPDRPDVLAPMRIKVTANRAKYPTLLSNGELVETRVSGELHTAIWNDPAKKPSYLFALVAGKLAVMKDTFTTMSGRYVDLYLYSDSKETLSTCKLAMRALKSAMRWDEVAFGREYDLSTYMIAATAGFNFGAMENRGLNIFNLKYVAGDQETATDTALMDIEHVVAHEYFHNWSGNLVTCRDWGQLSLKEGFTVYRHQEFMRETWGLMQTIDDVGYMRTVQFAEDAGPLAHPIRPDEVEEISNLYTTTVYEKGAEVVRMIATILGREAFRRGTDIYFERHFGAAATCEDFVKAMEDASGIDLGQFRLWYCQAGTPTVRVRTSYDPDLMRLSLTLRQSTPSTPGQRHKDPFHIPLRVGFVGKNGWDIRPETFVAEDCSFDLSTGVLHLRKREVKISFYGVKERPVLSLNRGFSAPIKIDHRYSDADLVRLAFAEGNDPLNRWESWRALGTRTILRLAAAWRRGKKLQNEHDMYLAAFQRLCLARMQGMDPVLFSAMFDLPSEGDVAAESTAIDPEAIHHARSFLERGLSRAARSAIESLSALSGDGEKYELTPTAVTERRIRNTALAHLIACGDWYAIGRVLTHFQRSDNMTDRLASLSLLVDADFADKSLTKFGLGMEVRPPLLDFYERHKGNKNAIDSWFSVQAASPNVGLREIRSLMKHPDFSFESPNRVRAVVQTFAMRNHRFHDRRGEGYAWLAGLVRRIDKKNPQLASRLVEALTDWKRYEKKLGMMMRAELRSLSREKLSLNVSDKVKKSLA